MSKSFWLSLVLLAVSGINAHAIITEFISDPVDDFALVRAVSGQKPVREFAAEMEALMRTITDNKKEQIEKWLGKPAAGPNGDYAMPVGQSRGFSYSGIQYVDPKLNKDHTAFYPAGDFAFIEVNYGIDGETPRYALMRFKTDKTFPKLAEIPQKADAEKPTKPVVIRKNTIDQEHWDQLSFGMSREKVAELFSGPAGDYAPGTEHLSTGWGRKGILGKKGREVLEWRSEKTRIVVEFDEKGKMVAAEIFSPGRDPVTNVADRLKWDRERFAKVKKHVEDRMAAK